MTLINPLDKKQPQSRIEVVKKCPKCGDEYSMNFTPRDAADWRVIYDNVGADAGCCQKCFYLLLVSYGEGPTPGYSSAASLPCDAINCIAGYNHQGHHVIVTYSGKICYCREK